MMTYDIKPVSPVKAKEWLDHDKALLIDIREPDEYAREHITGARLVPLSGFEHADFTKDKDRTAIFHCKSGMRTANAAEAIRRCGFKQAYMLEGGLTGWQQQGLPVNTNRKAPLEMQRQVHIAAGSLILTGVCLQLFVNPVFWVIPAFVGAGLLNAGISGWCGMAKLLKWMPWNRA